MSNFYLRPADQLFKLQIPLGFGGGQALAEDGGFVHLPSEIIIKMMIITHQECLCQPDSDRSNSRSCWRRPCWSCSCPHRSSHHHFIFVFILPFVFVLFLLFSLIFIFVFILLFVDSSFPFQNRPKCIATDNHLHPEEDGLVSFPFYHIIIAIFNHV